MAVDMYIKMGDVKGESVDSKHKDEIDVLAWSWGLSQSGTMHMGGGGGAGKVNVQDLSFTSTWTRPRRAHAERLQRKALPTAMRPCARRGHAARLPQDPDGCVISAPCPRGFGGDDRLTENITLNFAKVKMMYQAQKKDARPMAVPSRWAGTSRKIPS